MWPISVIYSGVLLVISVWWSIVGIIFIDEDNGLAIMLILGLTIITILSIRAIIFIFKRNELFIRSVIYQFIFTIIFITSTYNIIEDFPDRERFGYVLFGIVLSLTIAIITHIFNKKMRTFFNVDSL